MRYEMRAPCDRCGSEIGVMETRGVQDCVFCNCGKFQYNAPKSETGREVRSVSTERTQIKPKRRAALILRANGRCELCGKRGVLHVGHIISVKSGLAIGLTTEQINDDENFAVMCDECNLGLSDEPVPLRLAIGILLSRIEFRDNQDTSSTTGTESMDSLAGRETQPGRRQTDESPVPDERPQSETERFDNVV